MTGMVLGGIFLFGLLGTSPIVFASALTAGRVVQKAFVAGLLAAPIGGLWASVVAYNLGFGNDWWIFVLCAAVWTVPCVVIGLAAEGYGRSVLRWTAAGLVLTPVVTGLSLVTLALSYTDTPAVNPQGTKDRCPNCEGGVDKDDQFCQNCGSELDKIDKCPQCDSTIPEEAEFCPTCGMEQA